MYTKTLKIGWGVKMHVVVVVSWLLETEQKAGNTGTNVFFFSVKIFDDTQ